MLLCSGPREDATRIGSAGVIRRQAVDISPLRRVNSAIYLISTGAREASFRNIKTIAECLADELINAAKGSSNRYTLVPGLLLFISQGKLKLVQALHSLSEGSTWSWQTRLLVHFCLVLFHAHEPALKLKVYK